MKITKIRLFNLASIDGKAEIDFELEPLNSAGIFAISGPTGSGKSTILDALCLALYDKTPRFNATAESAYISDAGDEEINQSDVRNILRRGSSEGFAEVEFIAVDGDRYLSNWSVKRARNDATGKLQAQRISVSNLDRDEELQGTKTELLSQLTRLIGLSYEQFTRTVLLAQNDFATFLKSKENAKAELLEKLTGTEIYSSISKRIFERSKEEKVLADGLQSKIADIILLPLEEVKLIKKQREDLEKTLLAEGKQLDLYKKTEDVFARKKKTENDFNKAQVLAQSLSNASEKAKADIVAHQKNMALFEEKCVEVQSEIEKASLLDGQLNTLGNLLEQVKLKFSKASVLYQEKQQDVTSKEKRLKDLLGRLDVLLDKLNLPSTIGKNVDEVSNLLNNQIQASSIDQEKLKQEIEKIDADALATKRSKIDIEKKEWQLLNVDYTSFKKNLESVLELENLIKEYEETLIVKKQECIKFEEENIRENNNLLQLEKMFKEAQIRMGKTALSLRETLVDGEECPVCGSTHHFVDRVHKVTEYGVIGDELQLKQGLVKSLSAKQEAVKQEIKHLEVDITKTIEKTNELKSLNKVIVDKHSLQQLSEEYIQGVLKDLTDRDIQLAREMKSFTEMNVQFSQHVAVRDKLQQSKNQLDEINLKYKDVKSDLSSAEKELKLLLEQRTGLEKECTDENNIYQKIVVERSSLLKGKSVADAKSGIDNYRTKLKSDLTSYEEINAKTSVEYSTLKGRIEQLKEDLIAFNVELDGISEEDNTIKLSQLINQIDTDRKEVTKFSLRIKQQEENENKSKELNLLYHKQLLISEEWIKLSSLFGSKDGVRFTKIAQSYTLHILLLHANKHLSYLARRYKLEQVADSLSLQVIDQDMCDQVRTVYSLSGGESFLISLALALGLSSLSSNNLKVESLFIDEGFGSLDSESLRTAMDALEQLQIQGRKIGVISHVQEMSERISVQIHLNKGNSGKSSLSILG